MDIFGSNFWGSSSCQIFCQLSIHLLDVWKQGATLYCPDADITLCSEGQHPGFVDPCSTDVFFHQRREDSDTNHLPQETLSRRRSGFHELNGHQQTTGATAKWPKVHVFSDNGGFFSRRCARKFTQLALGRGTLGARFSSTGPGEVVNKKVPKKLATVRIKWFTCFRFTWTTCDFPQPLTFNMRCSGNAHSLPKN